MDPAQPEESVEGIIIAQRPEPESEGDYINVSERSLDRVRSLY